MAITLVVIGPSGVMRPGDWSEAYRQLHACGHPGAFVNRGLNLVCGAVIVAGHGSWAWPGAVLTGLGWLVRSTANRHRKTTEIFNLRP